MPQNLNVLLILVDSLRADMPWAGYPRDIAPRLTALEKTCVSYTRAYAVASHTAPSVRAMFFGKYPTELLRDGFFSTRFAKDNVSFVSLLKDASVTTMSGHAHEYMRRAGWDQGFSRYEVTPGLVWYPDLDENITAKTLSELAQKQLGELGGSGRFFAWYHFLDPHAKWQDHPKDGLTPWGTKSRDLYDGEVTYADGEIGKLLDFVAAQPWGARTMISASRDQDAATGCRRERHCNHQLRIIGNAGALRSLGSAPVEDELAFAVGLDVRGCGGHHSTFVVHCQVMRDPPRTLADAAGDLEPVQESMVQDRRVGGSDQRVPIAFGDLRDRSMNVQLHSGARVDWICAARGVDWICAARGVDWICAARGVDSDA